MPPVSPNLPEASENPFQSPQYGGAAPAGYDPYYAVSRVQGPAIGLMIVGGLGMVLRIMDLLAYFLAPQLMRMGNQNAQFDVLTMPVKVGLEVIALLLSVPVIYGALRMKNLDSYSWAMAASILGMLPCIGPCCCLGIPIGIWSLVVLSDSYVKAAFRA